MIAASRKKTDRRDAYWIARSLQTGMIPHPVYIPSGDVRELRRLLHRRRIVQRDRNRWQYRARAMLRAHGLRTRIGCLYLRRHIANLLEHPAGVDTGLLESLGPVSRPRAASPRSPTMLLASRAASPANAAADRD